MFAAALVLLAGLPAQTSRADTDALWRLVHDECVARMVAKADPAPCAAVDLSAGPEDGYAVLKDYEGPRQFLLIPTARIAGIESPALLDPDTPNYFAIAWRLRSFTEAASGGALARDWVSVAVNSAVARTQDQLHLHIDCLRADVHEALVRHSDAVGPMWAPFPTPLAGRHYSAVAVEGEDLEAHNPFQLLASGLPGAGSDMGSQTVVVAGAHRLDGSPGFVILASRVEQGESFGGEDLQDHQACPRPLPASPAAAK